MISGEKLNLRKKSLGDARNDYRWQTDAELARLDATPVADISYARYALNYAVQLRAPSASHRFFAVETRDGRHIGNCTYYNVDEKKREAEIGIMIGESSYWGKGYGTDAVKALVGHIFRETSVERLHLRTLEWNERAQRCFARCGFTPCGRLSRNGYDFIRMELHRKEWQAQQHEDKKPSRAVAGK